MSEGSGHRPHYLSGITMPSVEAIDKVNNFTEEAWRRYYYARHVRAFQNWQEMDEEKVNKTTRGLLDEHLLLRRMEADTAFNRMLRRKLARVEWIENHIQELGALVVLDILHPGQPTMQDADEIGGTTTRRNLQRLMRSYYPDLFIFHEDEVVPDDRRRTTFRTIFSATELSSPDEYAKATAYYLMEFEDRHIRGLIRGKFSEVIRLNLPIRLIDPDETCGLIKFSDRIGRLAGTLKVKWNDMEKDANRKKDLDWIIKHLRIHGIMPDQLYQMLFRVVLLRWYSEKSPIERKKLLFHRYKLIYTADDAARAISCNRKWFSNTCDVFDVMAGGVDAYLKLGEPRVGLTILGECLKIPDLDEFNRAICLQGMADCYRDLKKPGEMLPPLEEARMLWEAMDSKYDLARNWSGVAQARYLMANNDGFNEAWELAKDLVFKTDMPPGQQAWAMLYSADDAVQVEDQGWEREALEMGVQCASKMEKPDLFLYLNQRLIDLDDGKTTWLSELEPGKLRHPEEFKAIRPKGEYYIPILPSQIEGELSKRPKIKPKK